MKLFQFNLFGILFLLLILGLILFVPSLILQTIWNSTLSLYLERDLTINIWQALLLWAALITVLYMTGIFKIKLDFKTLNNIDINSIDDPELRAEIQELKLKPVEKPLKKKNKDKN